VDIMADEKSGSPTTKVAKMVGEDCKLTTSKLTEELN
jgi:hypothetical protein